VLDFAALPPEINSGRMYAGPGAESIMVAAAAWDGLAAELTSAASGYHSIITELTSGPWVGPSSAQMVAAVVPYVGWLTTAGAQAEESANQARAAAAAFEAAFAMTVPPYVVAANRVLLAALVATNFFGQNTPAIMATEAEYIEFWAQDAAAMYGYAGASAAATAFAPYQSPSNTTTPEGLFNQAVAVAESVAQPAGNSGQTAAATSSQLTQAATIPQLLQQLANNSPFINGLQQFLGAIPNGTNPFSVDIPANWATPILKQTLQAYFGIGLANFGWSIGQQTTRGLGTTVGAAGGWYPTPQFAGLHLGGAYGVNAVSGGGGNGALLASAGNAGKVGALSVPANWTTPTSEATTTLAAMEETPANAGAAGGTNALLRGMPMGAVGRRTAGYGYTNKYGFRYSVLTRPPSAG
jgi:PPE-repeat protein